MRRIRSPMLALLALLAACGKAPIEPPRTASAAHSPAATPREAVAPSAGPVPTEAMHQADALYRDQLATQGRDERFSTDRQIAALEHAILLYQQFLERAGDDPQYADAKRRSRDRIEDARATLIFLRQNP